MQFPSWLAWYKKPEYRDFKQYAADISTGRRSFSPDRRGSTCIPSRLKLERVLENKTCSPMSLYDFYMYLKYIEFSPENLEFYIWFKNYEAMHANDSTSSIAESDESESLNSDPDSTSSIVKPAAKPVEKSPALDASDFPCDPEIANETMNQITQLIGAGALCSPSNSTPSRLQPTVSAPTLGARIKSTLVRNGVAVQSATIRSDSTLNLTSVDLQRSELNAVITTFLLPSSPKELNIPPTLRNAALAALQTSASPAHLRPIADHIYQLLRNCSHRNFVRLGVSNGTYETICVATSLGIVLTISGFLCVMLLALLPEPHIHPRVRARWDAFAAWPLWWLGMSLILSGLRGSCFFLLLFSRRQPLPWERFDDDQASILSPKRGIMKLLSRLMVFDRKLKVKDVHLRKLQRKIVLQSLIGGALFATLSVLLFIFLPVWR